MNLQSILIAAAVVGGTGLVFGLILSIASFVFEIKRDERAQLILNELPGANCGACGFAGCSAYADAVVLSGAPVNCCSVGKAAVANKIAAIMGVEAGEVVEQVANVACSGSCDNVVYKYEYDGKQDCVSASQLAGGSKLCPSGCLGFGTCTTVCKFGAISVKDGVAVVDEEKCTACGQCLKACPKGIIHFVPKNNHQRVKCSNPEMGKMVNQYCKSGCIGCKLCEKNCPFDAIHVENNYAVIDYDKCKNCGICAKKCPRNVIHSTRKPAVKPQVEENAPATETETVTA